MNKSTKDSSKKNTQVLPQASLEDFAKKGNYRLKLETIEEENPKDANIRRTKDLVLFFVALFMILGIFVFCVLVVFSHEYGADEKKWATTALGVIISSLITHLVDRSNR